MTGETATDRQVWAITGSDRETFLQGLISNDIRHLGDGPVYAALLTPQGKYLADFLLLQDGERILVDLHDSIAAPTMQRLSLYRLRADVQIAPAGMHVVRGLGTPPEGAVTDPRHPSLGWRLYRTGPAAEPDTADAPRIDWDAIRVEHVIPETGTELVQNESYILECGFERLHGVDFRKGCYVGQEVTARMKHKTDLRKGLARITIDGDAAPGTEIMSSDGKPAGRLHTRAGANAIAWLRFDRAEGDMTAGEARVRLA